MCWVKLFPSIREPRNLAIWQFNISVFSPGEDARTADPCWLRFHCLLRDAKPRLRDPAHSAPSTLAANARPSQFVMGNNFSHRGIACAGTQVYAPRYREEWLNKVPHAGVRRRAELLYQQSLLETQA
jgi:hypothetical protein